MVKAGGRTLLSSRSRPLPPNSHPQILRKSLKIDNRIYLILENQLARFCNEVNLGTEPRRTTDGTYFFRDLGDEGPAAATPELPPTRVAFAHFSSNN
jgi:hypothetical protein